MKAQDPEAWRVLEAAGKLTVDNSVAAKTKEEEHCILVVPAP